MEHCVDVNLFPPDKVHHQVAHEARKRGLLCLSASEPWTRFVPVEIVQGLYDTDHQTSISGHSALCHTIIQRPHLQQQTL